MTPSEVVQVVTARARAAVDKYLDNFRNHETFLDRLGPAVKGLSEAGDGIIPALNEALDDPHALRRLYAAWFLLGVSGKVPGAVNERFLERAARAVVEILQRGMPLLKHIACALFSMSGGLPASAIPVVTALQTARTDDLSVSAAAALCASNLADSSSLPVVSKALRSEKEPLVAMAAHALGKLGVQETEAVRQLVAALSEKGTTRQGFAVEALQLLGRPGRAALPQLSVICLDAQVNAYVRGKAAWAVGTITEGTADGDKVLLKALRSSQWQVVEGALHGLRVSGRFPAGTVARLIPHLSAEDETMRRVAAAGVSDAGPQAREALPALLERIGQEPNIYVCHAVAGALAAVGHKAIPLLIERLRQGDTRNMPVVLMALKRLGQAAAAEVAGRMFSDPDVAVRALGVVVVRELGPQAGPAVPSLAAMLNGADDESTLFLLTAILACGTAARQATPAVVHCLAHRSDEISWAARRFLKQLGAEAVPELETAATHTTGPARVRIAQALDELRGAPHDEFAVLRKLSKDNWLITFAAVGTILEREGPLGFDMMETLIDSGYELEFRPKTFKSSTLRTTLNKLAEKLHEHLVTQEQGKRSGLTDYGRKLLPQVKKYLRTTSA